MKNKNMMMMGIVMIICQIIVLGMFGLLFAYDAGTRIMIPNTIATAIVVATFLTLINVLALILISYGASDSQ